MLIKEESNYFPQQPQQSKQISSDSLNSLSHSSFSTSHEQLNQDKKAQIKECSYDYEKTRTNTNSQIKHVTFLEPFVRIINVRSYKKYNKLPSLDSSKKKHKPYYDFGQDNIICKCVII